MPMATGREHYGGNTAAKVGKLSKRGRNAAERPCARWLEKNFMRSRKAMLIGWSTNFNNMSRKKEKKRKKGDARHRSYVTHRSFKERYKDTAIYELEFKR